MKVNFKGAFVDEDVAADGLGCADGVTERLGLGTEKVPKTDFEATGDCVDPSVFGTPVDDVVVGNEKAPALNAEEVTALPVFEFPVGALKLNELCGLLGSAWVKLVAGLEAEADVLLKKGVEVVAVFSAGLAMVVDPVGALEKKFGRLVDVDIEGAVTLSEDGAVTVI